MPQEKTIIGAGGRIVIPSPFRKSLGIGPGDEVLLVLQEGELRVRPKRLAVKRAQEIVRRYVRPGRRLAQELTRERREEARHE